ncbi:MAG: hypothetical protein GAK35_03406 [Herbaspirillum frisingense]|uniref:RHS repeat protein n=1 Tax=Herbaspirillum frisingense TaxID=92645 RepID=A0A7V8JT64_9BURK|nr:MAG: hypothetical protein GAK35_03406 [Herbaspirillum frisingense]
MMDQKSTIIAYNADGTVASITKTDGRLTWVKTFSYTNGQVTAISKWVQQ